MLTIFNTENFTVGQVLLIHTLALQISETQVGDISAFNIYLPLKTTVEM